ncbi:hypothetical protein CkaCkLH20_08844 [Colletotrichum karsti]|uniref:Uncharacterized protein n=1 Tax=Colletotrichum karsti TaxID=1095194 RepID=A0A9P6LF26_9PEZI|nr:uncharacterized protein CkaCkLH20_08844 [Colletotrichum karsti]KAF9873734.1 hypothetical protein CkaCkLH20_08844 [Colletotrichum karsti]
MEPFTYPVDEAIMRRILEAVSKLRNMYQQPGQTYDDFIMAYDALETELSVRLPELYRVCDVLIRLLPELRWQVVSHGIPSTREDLDAAARRADGLAEDFGFMRSMAS